MPAANPPLTLGLDGADVHASSRGSWFEVIVGKSVTAAGEGKYAAFVHNCDDKPKRRLYEGLKSQSLQPDQPVRFLSAGDDTEFGAYIAANQAFIPDYGDRYRNQETITTAFVGSAVITWSASGWSSNNKYTRPSASALSLAA